MKTSNLRNSQNIQKISSSAVQSNCISLSASNVTKIIKKKDISYGSNKTNKSLEKYISTKIKEIDVHNENIKNENCASGVTPKSQLIIQGKNKNFNDYLLIEDNIKLLSLEKVEQLQRKDNNILLKENKGALSTKNLRNKSLDFSRNYCNTNTTDNKSEKKKKGSNKLNPSFSENRILREYINSKMDKSVQIVDTSSNKLTHQDLTGSHTKKKFKKSNTGIKTENKNTYLNFGNISNSEFPATQLLQSENHTLPDFPIFKSSQINTVNTQEDEEKIKNLEISSDKMFTSISIIPQPKESLTPSKSENNLTNNLNNISDLNVFSLESDSNFFPSESFSKFQNIKKGLIELVNETKDKSQIIRELDIIYKNILKVSNPSVSCPEEEITTNSNLNFTRCMSNFGVGDNLNNLAQNFNNISGVSKDGSTSVSKPSLHNGINKDPSNPSMDEQISGQNSQIHLENESLRKENDVLQSKIMEIDKKFEKILKENEELKGFVNKKAANIQTMEYVIKQFQNELNEVKKNQMNNLIGSSGMINQINNTGVNFSKQLQSSKNIKNKPHSKISRPGMTNINNYHSSNYINSANSFNKPATATQIKNSQKNFYPSNQAVNANKNIVNKYPRNMQNSRIDSQNTYNKDNKNFRSQMQIFRQNNDNPIQEETSASFLQTTTSVMSIDSLRINDKNMYYYPTKVNYSSSQQGVMKNNMIPKIKLNTFVC